jgi:hypothetical protein
MSDIAHLLTLRKLESIESYELKTWRFPMTATAN